LGKPSEVARVIDEAVTNALAKQSESLKTSQEEKK